MKDERSAPLNRQEDIILKMSKSEFNALISMVESDAIAIGGADEEFTIPTIKRVKSINKMLLRNGIKREIKY